MRESCGQRGKQVSVPIFSGHPNTDNAGLNPLSLSRVHGSSYSLSLSDTTTRACSVDFSDFLVADFVFLENLGERCDIGRGWTRLDAGFVNLKISVAQGGAEGMDSARSWFQKFQPRERVRPSARKKEGTGAEKEETNPTAGDETPSNVTKQKVAAAKQYIENHYKEQMKSLQERRERYDNTLKDKFEILGT
ncbi:hypothetical protein CK203_008772 [Vitis vinifera]|uniref:Uncharacterized protein n=1 Tax=Vitis vinifera TaxID=29760 RepID=A0A438KDV8_VITVI|nr:hypothetical protein CK203_008772 [Vitis vinifera]